MIKVGNTRRNPMARAIRNAFDPRELFRPTTQGAIYAYDSFDYLYQKADGSVPVTALEQPVGLVVDQRYGNAVGSELVQASYSGSVSGSWLIGSSSITRNGDTSGFASLTLSSGLTTTSRYVVTFTVSNFSGDDLGFRLGAAGTAYRISANGTYTFRVLPGATTAILRFLPWAGTAGQCTISAVSVRELPGLHAYQSTDAARPVISARYNLLLGTATLSTQSVTTLAASYTLTFTGTGTVTLSGTATGVKSAGTNVFTATAGTLTLTVSGSVTLADLRLTADANARLPAYQRVTTATDYDSAGFPRFLRIDATDDFLQTAPVDPGTDKVFVCAGVTKVSDAATAVLLESSATSSSTAGTFGLLAPISGVAGYQFRSGGTSPGQARDRAGFAAPDTSVLSGIANIAGPSVELRVNQTTAAAITASQGTGNYTAQPIYIGARAGSSLRLNNGRIYPMVIAFKLPTAGEIAAVEAWVNARTRAY